MCGIAGIWSLENKDDNRKLIELMKTAIKHRGPDGHGSWFSSNGSLALGHQRLSIIDLSSHAAQPMTLDEELVITYNGEIYNYIEIRKELKELGFSFKTQSDTEVLLTSYKVWGIDMLQRLDGMFSIAIYDIAKDELFIARDRFGEKPFYYTKFNNKLYFGSELKALFAGGVPKRNNNRMLYNFLANDLVENPNDQQETFYENIFKLKPSHYCIIKKDLNIEQRQYWNLDITTNKSISFDEATNKFYDLLSLSVKRRLRSDVKVGNSLSGGLDSSAIVGLVSKENDIINTFSARFPNFKKDEGYFINLVQDKFKTVHHDVRVDENSLVSHLDRLIYHQDEPFQTGSIFAQYKVYEAAKKQGITVMLDGQGADEYLCGYHKDFNFFYRELIRIKQTNDLIVKHLNTNHNFVPDTSFKEFFHVKNPVIFNFLRNNFSFLIPKSPPHEINKDFNMNYKPKKSPFLDPLTLKEMLKGEMTTQGIEKLLRFSDRNSMAHSVEVRLPFLFHELVGFVLSLPSELLLKEGWSKAILRNSVKDLLPTEIVHRKDKVGFEAPHNVWTKSKTLQEMIYEARTHLIKENIITKDYKSDWKILIVYKSMFS